MMKADISCADASAWLRYDSESGLLYWKTKIAPCLRVGALAGCIDRYGYRTIGIKGKIYKAHRLVWLIAYGEWPSVTIDHIDEDKANNRLGNLRLATVAQNCSNRNNGPGVFYHIRKGRVSRWRATIRVNNKSVWLGYHDTEAEAKVAYDAAKLRYHGEYAYLGENKRLGPLGRRAPNPVAQQK